MDKIYNIIFDVDDVLNNLNDYILNKLGLPWGSRYSILDCPEYTDEQKKSILAAYIDPKTFENIEYVPGASEIFDLEDQGNARVKIISCNLNPETAGVKIASLFANIPGVSIENTELQIRNGFDKEIDLSADIIVEDCIENAIRYEPETIKILIDKPYNKAEVYGLDEESENIIRVASLLEAIQYIKDIIT